MQNPTCGSMTKSAGGSDRTQTLKKVWMWDRLSQSSVVNPNRRHTLINASPTATKTLEQQPLQPHEARTHGV